MRGDVGYWDAIAEGANFTHPLNESWIAEHADPEKPVLDYGCGYGRMLSTVQRLGFKHLLGVDPSSGMIERAHAVCPDANLTVLSGQTVSTDLDPSSVGLVLLVAVLTCVPDDDIQRSIVSEIERVLAPGGFLFVSDFLLQNDTRNLVRYARFEGAGYPYGVFEIDEGRTAMRHHDGRYLVNLFSNFETVLREEFDLKTMKGNPAVGTRFLFRKPGRARLS